MEYHGYAGRILYVDLSTGQIEKQPLDIEMAQRFLGGSGINYRLGYDLLKPGVDPLSPDNGIILGSGPFSGTLVPSNSRLMATTKFPINGRWASAYTNLQYDKIPSDLEAALERETQ